MLQIVVVLLTRFNNASRERQKPKVPMLERAYQLSCQDKDPPGSSHIKLKCSHLLLKGMSTQLEKNDNLRNSKEHRPVPSLLHLTFFYFTCSGPKKGNSQLYFPGFSKNKPYIQLILYRPVSMKGMILRIAIAWYTKKPQSTLKSFCVVTRHIQASRPYKSRDV